MADERFVVSPSPHLLGARSTRAIMLDVIIALLPAAAASAFIFGIRTVAVIAMCVGVSVMTEYLFTLICRKPVSVDDLSACVTGLLLALNLPSGIPLWQAAVGSVFAIAVVKCLFGGIGQNFANPAITARIMMIIAFTGSMSTFGQAVGADTASSATPLQIIASGASDTLPSIGDMLLGLRSGSLGETCAVALIAGGIYLVCRKVISWATPVAFIGTVFVFSLIIKGDPVSAIYQVLGGGLLIGAIFMATDYSTTPTGTAGKLIFGFGCGLITCLIRFWGSYPEGVSFSILLMNILTPYIDKWTRRKPVGGAKA
ncbi:MAG: RnfABCDGE type electron transport complex subunit D [Eubacteriales bacterium]